MFTLFTAIGMAVMAIVGAVAGTMIPYYVYLVAILVPSIAVLVRRLHDVGKSGWVALFGIVPIIGGIAMLVYACTEGTSGPNPYGPDPKPAPAYPTHYA
jgi:uncharacterized membrane protein YhaH (DUF805 family)